MDEYRKGLTEACEFQDFIADELLKEGIILMSYASRKRQLNKENGLGLEIKYDKRFAETGNFYIELFEKTKPENPNWIPSGINAAGENWLFGIGNYETFFIFSVSHLCRVSKKMQTLKRVETPTSKGLLIPETTAQKLALKIVYFN